jgi:hypothetical protein
VAPGARWWSSHATDCFSKDSYGRGGIRTHGTLLTYTHFPGVRLKPLGHPSQQSVSYQFTTASRSVERPALPATWTCEVTVMAHWPIAGRQVAPKLLMTSPQRLMEALLENPLVFEELVRIRTDVAQRLKRFCSDLSDDQFASLVHAVSRVQFTEGLDWPEKEARRKYFDRHFPTE